MSLQHLYKIFCLIIQVLQVCFWGLQIKFVMLINDDADGDNTCNNTYINTNVVIIIIIVKVRVLSLML